ncbi:hypothetical protein [Novosphingobium guangzhouense]|uniref:Pathogenicity locus n=1 Tax=Novosphingobium guangzhouense TaxID=1850347 RepID=A0A2K2G117_9SPHN|nr:hypothetical protein [Novosphingobium guangzhouense]PNU04717.1 hypothetical protein A8V01_19155 [Novosphingobium guangzhouense]
MDRFDETERAALLAVKGVGPTVLSRLEELGIAGFAQLAAADADDICAKVSVSLGATCWRNSPQARRAVAAAIERAREP